VSLDRQFSDNATSVNDALSTPHVVSNWQRGSPQRARVWTVSGGAGRVLASEAESAYPLAVVVVAAVLISAES
jgi:hypothetical protein